MKRAGVLTISDSRSRGLAQDTTTDLIRSLLQKEGFSVTEAHLVADNQEEIEARLIQMADGRGLALILTTGGTGFGPRDVTPEATRRVVEREIPGLPEAMRIQTAKQDPRAWLSRAAAGLRGRTLMVNLPGSPKGVRECLTILLPLLPHALQMVEGKSHGH